MPKCADLNLNMCQQNSSSEHLKDHLFKFHWKIVPIPLFSVEMFYLNSTLNFGILPVLVFQLEVDRLLTITGLTAKQKGTTARWYSNKTSIIVNWPFTLKNSLNHPAIFLRCLYI